VRRKTRKNYRLEVRGSSALLKTYPKTSVTVAVLSDIHAPFYDPHAIELALRIISQAEPDVVILNGDVVDFVGISRFSTSPVRRAHFHQEVEQCADFLRFLVPKFRGADVIYLAGNHEERLKRYLWSRAPELSHLSALSVDRLLDLERLGVIYLETSEHLTSFEDFVAAQVVINERLYITHGHSIRSAGNLVNVARTVYHKVLVPMLIGHWHRVQHHEETSYDGRTSGVWVSGCLCYPRPAYDAGRIWGQGICIIDVKGEWFRPTLVSFFRRDRMLHAIYNGTLYSLSLDKKPRVPIPVHPTI
jgi:predicted phosphodiesterase